MIEGEGIVLRALEPEDVDLLYEWENDMKLWVVSNTLTPFSKYQLKKYIESSKLNLFQTKQLRLMVDAVEDGKEFTVGMIDLFDFEPFHGRGGVGIVIHSDYRGKGYAKKALNTFVDYCFGYLHLHQLYANILSDNEASIALFSSVGFDFSGRKKEWIKTFSGYVDELFFQKINEGR
jgi:diamine N-acetyltransferase